MNWRRLKPDIGLPSAAALPLYLTLNLLLRGRKVLGSNLNRSEWWFRSRIKGFYTSVFRLFSVFYKYPARRARGWAADRRAAQIRGASTPLARAGALA
jgi:hypothetical protein